MPWGYGKPCASEAMDKFKLKTMLVRHEGIRLNPYKDTVGKLTIGIGRNLDDTGISENEAYYLLSNDIDRAVVNLREIFKSFDTFTDDRQIALVDMMLNLGKGGFCGFRNMINAIDNEDWNTASLEALDSKWANQVGNRAKEIVLLLRVG